MYNDPYLGQDDLNILERKITLLRDEISLVLSKVRGKNQITVSPQGYRDTYDTYDNYDDMGRHGAMRSSQNKDLSYGQQGMSFNPGHHGGTEHLHHTKSSVRDQDMLHTPNNMGGLKVSIRSGYNREQHGHRGDPDIGSTAQTYMNPNSKSNNGPRVDGMSGYAHLRDKLTLMQTGQY